MLLGLLPAALDELEAAVLWHEAERPGHGALLVDEVRKRVAQAARLPKSGAPIAGLDPGHDVRAYPTSRFPYRVITAVVRGTPMVIAVAHARRAPEYWRDRLSSAD